MELLKALADIFTWLLALPFMAWTEMGVKVAGDTVSVSDWNNAAKYNPEYLLNDLEPELTNQSGGDMVAGDVVVHDPSNDQAFTSSTTQADPDVIGVLTEAINNTASGRVARMGMVTVNVQGNVSRGDYLRQSTTAKRAESAGATIRTGCFGVALTEYTGGAAGTVTAMLFGATISQAGDGAVEVQIGGGVATIDTGIQARIVVPFDLEIESWEIGCKETGSITIDVWQDTHANFPPTDADSLVGTGTEPNVATSDKGSGNASDWSGGTRLLQGYWLFFNVDSVTDITQCTIALRGKIVP